MTKRTLLPLLFAATILATSCASSDAPPFAPPPWTDLPPTIAEAVCLRARGEAISHDSPIAAINVTQPGIVNGSSIYSLSHAFGMGVSNPVQLADTLRSATAPMPVLFPMMGMGSCTFRPIEAADQQRVTDVMLLQLSSPILNPFVKKEAGVLARLSLGNRNAMWYWVPLAERKEKWLIGTAIPLDLHEE
jgi:hypothetical protein